MDRFRSSWLALIGGALLVALSVSAAFGAAPAGTDANRGQTIAGFVHELVFGTDEEEEPPASEECDPETDPDGCEPTGDEECDPLTGPDTCEPVEEECDPATDPDGCEPTEEDGSEEGSEGESDEDGTHGACVSEVARDKEAVGGKNDNHGGAVSEAARETCRDGAGDEEEATEEEASADTSSTSEPEAKKAKKSGHGKPSWAGNGGRGGGRP